MKQVFFDETGDSSQKDYFGLCSAVFDGRFYSSVKEKFQSILSSGSWDGNIEFKGSCLFSATKGDISVPVEKRIQMASEILDLNTSQKNARMKFFYLRKISTRHKEDYLRYLPILLDKALTRGKKGKNLITINCDFRSDTSIPEIRKAVLPVLRKKGWVLFEDVVICKSNYHTVGILFSDIVAYLSSRVDTISNDSELFSNVPTEEFQKNGKIRKFLKSYELIKKIKKFDRYEVKLKKAS